MIVPECGAQYKDFLEKEIVAIDGDIPDPCPSAGVIIVTITGGIVE